MRFVVFLFLVSVVAVAFYCAAADGSGKEVSEAALRRKMMSSEEETGTQQLKRKLSGYDHGLGGDGHGSKDHVNDDDDVDDKDDHGHDNDKDHDDDDDDGDYDDGDDHDDDDHRHKHRPGHNCHGSRGHCDHDDAGKMGRKLSSGSAASAKGPSPRSW